MTGITEVYSIIEVNRAKVDTITLMTRVTKTVTYVTVIC